MTEPFGICKVRFLDKNQKPSQSEYSYFVSEEIFKKILIKVKATDSLAFCTYNIPSFKLINEGGYDYRGSRVIPVGLYDKSAIEFDELKSKTYRWIHTINWDKTFCDDVTSFNGTYSLETSKVATTLSSVADSAKQASDAFHILCISANDLSDLDAISTGGNYITINYDGVTSELEEIRRSIENLKKENEEKETPSMFNNIMKNVKFGAVPSAEVRMSIYGPAFNTKDGWLAWSEKDNTYLDVSDMLLDMENFCYMAPVAKKDVKPGDFIYHHNSWLRVINQREDGRVVAEVILNQVETTLIPTKNVFGFDFYTKLISFGSNIFNASSDMPFGNMLPLLMMNKSDNSALPMLMMMNGGTMGNMSFDMSNPMFLYLMMNKDDSNTHDMFMLMMMAMMQNNTTTPYVCNFDIVKEDNE